MTENIVPKKSIPFGVQRILYIGFLLLGSYYLFQGQLVEAGSTLGIGLIFDPFNGVAWQQRKAWQKGWLLVHLVLTFGLLIAGFVVKS